MPVTRCPHCGQRMVVAAAIVGQTVGCSRCEHTYEARLQTSANRLGEFLLVAAAIVVGGVVAWLIVKSR